MREADNLLFWEGQIRPVTILSIVSIRETVEQLSRIDDEGSAYPLHGSERREHSGPQVPGSFG